jgi:putative nucleotidyltransferase with HDIG domain
MKYKALPASVSDLLRKLEAPPRLVAHLTLVHDVADKLTVALKQRFPTLEYDRAAVLMGAAIHDIGKVKYRDELTGGGSEHEVVGPEMLKELGFDEKIARFAWTHGGEKREPNPTLEDLLVQQADTIWKGKRNQRFETKVIKMICQRTSQAEWEVFAALDDILVDLAVDADERLAWQSIHEV